MEVNHTPIQQPPSHRDTPHPFYILRSPPLPYLGMVQPGNPALRKYAARLLHIGTSDNAPYVAILLCHHLRVLHLGNVPRETWQCDVLRNTGIESIT